MQAVDFKPPTPENASAPGRTRPDPAHPRSAAEGFDAVMGRALARSSRETPDDSDSDAPPPDRRPTDSKKTDSPDPSTIACADPSAVPTTPPPVSSTPAAGSRNEVVPATDGVDSSQEVANSSAETIAGLVNNSSETSDSSRVPDLSPVTGKISSEQTSDLTAATSAPAETTGISGAKYHAAQQKAENMNNFSGSTEQNLPMNDAANADESPKAVHSTGFKLHADKSEPSAAPASSFSGTSSLNDTAPAAISAAESSWPVRSLERTHDLMSLQALRLRESGQDSLQVVIKPDTGLQLSLNLQMRDGNVEMRAQLHRGNFELLNLHWPELQQQLESRGIRLGPLAQSDTATDGQGFSQSPDQRPSEERTAPAGAFAEFALNSTLVPKPAPRAGTTAARGWESWA